MQTKDISGKKFGRLQVLRIYTERDKGVRWVCRCDCGKEIVASGIKLRSGQVKSCGCLSRNQLKDRVFGHLTVLRELQERKRGHILWLCECVCGKQVKVQGVNLTRGRTPRLTGGEAVPCSLLLAILEVNDVLPTLRGLLQAYVSYVGT